MTLVERESELDALTALLAAAPLTEITADELCRGARRPRRARWATR